MEKPWWWVSIWLLRVLNFLRVYLPFKTWLALCAGQIVYVYYGLINKRTRWDWTDVAWRHWLALALYFSCGIWVLIGPGLLLFLNTKLLYFVWNPVSEYLCGKSNLTKFCIAKFLFLTFTSLVRLFQMHYFSTWGVRVPEGVTRAEQMRDEPILKLRGVEAFFKESADNKSHVRYVLTEDGRRCVLSYEDSIWEWEFKLLGIFSAALLFYFLRAYKVMAWVDRWDWDVPEEHKCRKGKDGRDLSEIYRGVYVRTVWTISEHALEEERKRREETRAYIEEQKKREAQRRKGKE